MKGKKNYKYINIRMGETGKKKKELKRKSNKKRKKTRMKRIYKYKNSTLQMKFVNIAQ